MLIAKLRVKAAEGPADLNRFFNYTSFDLISELSFGDSFGCLGKADYHPFVKLFWGGVKVVPFLHAAYYYNLMPIMRFFTPSHLVKARQESARYAYDKVNKRLAKENDSRRDFWHYIAEGEKESGQLAMEEKHNLGANLIFAGSETTATTLSGCVYLMLKNHRCYEAFVREARSTFKRQEDITILAVSELKFLQAIINETLRVYNAVPGEICRPLQSFYVVPHARLANNSFRILPSCRPWRRRDHRRRLRPRRNRRGRPPIRDKRLPPQLRPAQRIPARALARVRTGARLRVPRRQSCRVPALRRRTSRLRRSQSGHGELARRPDPAGVEL